MLNLFYAEPDGDRWLPFDRHPRRLIRRLVRGRPIIGGHARILLNLCAGLDRIGMPYRVNDFRFSRQNPDELACIIGKPFLLNANKWTNPILFGAAVYSHPLDDPSLFERLPVAKVLVPGPWMKDMFDLYWNPRVESWPVGIDTEAWSPVAADGKTVDVLLYDKVRWEHDRYDASLIEPIRQYFLKRKYSFLEIRYGSYRDEDFSDALAKSRAMVFLCEHETQGIAYQQAMSCGVPIFAWDRGGSWQDPSYYPDKVKFGPVTSVPYWDARCGARFLDYADFEARWSGFWDGVSTSRYRPRDYVLENLTLEKCASDYVRIVNSLA